MVTCGRWQEAVSARLDGEDPGIGQEALDAHARVCRDCRQFAGAAGALDTLPVPRPPEAAGRSVGILAAVRAADRAAARRRPPAPHGAVRPALALVGMAQLLTSLPYLVSLADAHVMRDLAAFELALGVGFLVAAARPATAAGLLPTAGALVVVLGVVVVADVISGRAAAASEAVHVTEAAGVGLLWLLASRTPALWRLRPV